MQRSQRSSWWVTDSVIIECSMYKLVCPSVAERWDWIYDLWYLCQLILIFERERDRERETCTDPGTDTYIHIHIHRHRHRRHRHKQGESASELLHRRERKRERDSERKMWFNIMYIIWSRYSFLSFLIIPQSQYYLKGHMASNQNCCFGKSYGNVTKIVKGWRRINQHGYLISVHPLCFFLPWHLFPRISRYSTYLLCIVIIYSS